MQKKLVAEALGTFTLTLAVLSSLQMETTIISTSVVAALVLALFVYTIGARSGCHLNPAVSLGLWSIGKLKPNEAVSYILAQLLGALLAFGLVSLMLGKLTLGIPAESAEVFVAELIGAALFTFGIAAVVYGKVADSISGLVVGGSLLLGILLAAQFGSAGIINPAVALALGALNLSYVLGSVIGGVVGMNLYKRVIV
ncbi:MAG TPA: aquaporin [Candidatus Paceibacterota bacterium]